MNDPIAHSVVLPTGSLIASVWSDVPTQPLEVLLPYIEADTHEGAIVDWLLTSDAIAFGDVDIPQLYLQWRSRWVRSWALEPLSSVRALHAICDELLPAEARGEWRDRIGHILETGEPGLVAIDDLAPLRFATETLRDLVLERETTGFGIVDATPGRTTPGLSFAWSSMSAAELFAKDEQMEVWLTPDRGLRVRTSSNDGLTDAIVSSVRIAEDAVLIESDGEEWSVSPDRARPLSWLVPGASQWRVRTVPEVIVWAKTFACLPESCEYALDVGKPMHLTTEAPVLPVSTPSIGA